MLPSSREVTATHSGWQKYDNGSWNSVTRPTTSQQRSTGQANTMGSTQARGGSEGMSQLEQDRTARMTGGAPGIPGFGEPPAGGLAAGLGAARVSASDSAFAAVAAVTALLCVLASLTAWFTVPGQASPWPRQTEDSGDESNSRTSVSG